MQAITYFQPISADILDRSGAHRAGNQAKIFQPRPALLQSPLHEIMPVLARAGFDVEGRAIFLEQLLAGDRDVQNKAVKIACQHQIAAATKDETTFPGQVCYGQLLFCRDFLIARRLAGQGKGVERDQINVFLTMHRC